MCPGHPPDPWARSVCTLPPRPGAPASAPQGEGPGSPQARLRISAPQSPPLTREFSLFGTKSCRAPITVSQPDWPSAETLGRARAPGRAVGNPRRRPAPGARTDGRLPRDAPARRTHLFRPGSPLAGGETPATPLANGSLLAGVPAQGAVPGGEDTLTLRPEGLASVGARQQGSPGQAREEPGYSRAGECWSETAGGGGGSAWLLTFHPGLREGGACDRLCCLVCFRLSVPRLPTRDPSRRRTPGHRVPSRRLARAPGLPWRGLHPLSDKPTQVWAWP